MGLQDSGDGDAEVGGFQGVEVGAAIGDRVTRADSPVLLQASR
jgi:hypothetical protein